MLITKDGNNPKSSISIAELSTLTHNITVTYEYSIDGDINGAFIVAQATVTQDFSNGKNSLTIQNNDVVFSFDSDNDKTNNITEILDGSNPFDFPPWVWVSGESIFDSVGNYGEKGVPAATNSPPARDGAVSWIDKDNQLCLYGGESVYISGTSTSSKNYVNDLWCWNDKNWVWKAGSSETNSQPIYGLVDVIDINNDPGARLDAVSSIGNNFDVWLFGGKIFDINSMGINYKSDLWQWDGDNWIWKSGSKSVNSFGNYGQIGFSDPNAFPGARSEAISWTDSLGSVRP